MGEVSETMVKKKKKGRPSLIDLQKRALKQEQLLQQQKKQDEQEVEHRFGFKNPNLLNLGSTPGRRSTRRNPNLNGIYTNSALIDDEEGDDERREKKHKLLHGLNSHTHRHSSNSQSADSDLNPDETSKNPLDSVKRRKISGVVHGSKDTGEKFSKATYVAQGSPMESDPTTPLPDNKLLVFILDRLQKKDTYGVFAEPVDPEELPDYHEIIANPMDFSTVRKKLDSGFYTNLEQFERDVFLICTNAMEYNPSETIYFRQARAMHEMAKKDFENLRRESDDEEAQPKVVKKGRPPSKSLKKQLEIHFVDCPPTEISADITLSTGGDSSKLSGAYNLRKAPSSYRFRPADTPVRTSHTSETQSSWSIDWENEFPSSVVRAVNKYGMKHFNVDENRRDTYNQLSSLREPSVMATLEDELKQLIPVGLNTEYGYARSLARYAATLGPVAWKIASRRIGSVLPPGIKFGPGWVEEDTCPENAQQQILFSGKQKWSNNSASDDHSSKLLSPTTSVSNSFIGNREETGLVPAQTLNSETKTVMASSLNHMKPSSSSNSKTHQSGPLIKPEKNGVIPGFSSHNQSNQMMGMVKNLTEPSSTTQQGSSLCSNKQDMHRFGPDLNARFTSPNSPGSNLQMVSSQQPDLALQL